MSTIAKYEDFEELIKVMNESFNEDFEKILPKLYFKDNKNMVHFITKINEKIVSSIGLYDVLRISPYGTLKVGIVGAVSTLPNYRNKGYMKENMNALIEYAKNNNYDLLMLGGDRIRYSHFGFEYAGKSYQALITKRSKYLLNPEKYIIREATKEDYEYILRMYKRRKQYVDRNIDMLDKILASWESKTYIVEVNENKVGYYCISKDNSMVYEFAYDKQYLDTILDACLSSNNAIRVNLIYEDISDSLLEKIHMLDLHQDYSYKILNLDNVMEYMNIDLKHKEKYLKMNESKMTRKILGDIRNDSNYSSLKYIYTSVIDHG